MYSRAKPIDTRVCIVRELSESGDVKLWKVAGEQRKSTGSRIHQGTVARIFPEVSSAKRERHKRFHLLQNATVKKIVTAKRVDSCFMLCPA
jgi:hypothetical protein